MMSPIRLPASRGFSFCCWFRVEAYPSFAVSDGPLGGAMGLFKFATEQGKGYTGLIQDFRILINVCACTLKTHRFSSTCFQTHPVTFSRFVAPKTSWCQWNGPSILSVGITLGSPTMLASSYLGPASSRSMWMARQWIP